MNVDPFREIWILIGSATCKALETCRQGASRTTPKAEIRGVDARANILTNYCIHCGINKHAQAELISLVMGATKTGRESGSISR